MVCSHHGSRPAGEIMADLRARLKGEEEAPFCRGFSGDTDGLGRKRESLSQRAVAPPRTRSGHLETATDTGPSLSVSLSI